ncbi:MAG: hypothetical protein AB8B88_11810 [Devosiaceae bacterium]
MISPAKSPPVDTSRRARLHDWLQRAKPMLARAGLIGACFGIAIIGILENYNRFGDPEAIYRDARLQPSEVGHATDQPASRSDRLVTVDNALEGQIAAVR